MGMDEMEVIACFVGKRERLDMGRKGKNGRTVLTGEGAGCLAAGG
jgi:hypothetical protein